MAVFDNLENHLWNLSYMQSETQAIRNRTLSPLQSSPNPRRELD